MADDDSILVIKPGSQKMHELRSFRCSSNQRPPSLMCGSFSLNPCAFRLLFFKLVHWLPLVNLLAISANPWARQTSCQYEIGKKRQFFGRKRQQIGYP